jgi:hypothetical protein
MEAIKAKSLDTNLVFFITKSSNAHIIAFYWANNEIETKWLLRHDGSTIDAIQDLTLIQSIAMGLSLQEDSQGRLEVHSNLPFKQKLYFAKLDTEYALIFDAVGATGAAGSGAAGSGLSQLHEAYLDVESAMCVCKCSNIASKKTFVETFQVDAAKFL